MMSSGRKTTSTRRRQATNSETSALKKRKGKEKKGTEVSDKKSFELNSPAALLAASSSNPLLASTLKGRPIERILRDMMSSRGWRLKIKQGRR